MKKYATLILILFAIQNLTAQKHYLEGFIVQTDGDTIKGFIGYNNWNDNPDYVNYRSTKEGQTIKYLPYEILAFGVNEDLFESSFVYYEISPRATEILKFNPDLQLEQKQVFLRILYKGEKTLALYKTHSGIDNFYIYYGDKYELLIYKKYLQTVDEKTLAKSNKKYLGQLLIYFQKCPELQSKIESASYSFQSLANVFAFYYAKCNNKSMAYKLKEEKDVLVWSIFGGITHQTLSFFNYMVVNESYAMEPSLSPAIGGALDITFRRSFKHWSLNSELMYTYIDTKNESNLVSGYESTSWILKYSYISMNNMFRYQYEFGKLQIFANFGMTNGYAISMQSIENTTNPITNETKTSDMGLDRKLEFGILYGIGGRFMKKYQFELRYQTSSGMSPYFTAPSGIRRWFILFSYRF